MRRHTKSGGDFFRAETAFLRQLLERLELVGGMHVLACDVFVEADFVGVVRRVDDAADRFGLLDLLAFNPQQLRQPAAFADGDKIGPGCRAIRIQFRLDDKILQNAFRGDAGSVGLDGRLAVRRLAGILRGLLELVERNETLGSALDNGFNMLGRHDHSPFRAWVQSAPCACTPARRRDRGSKGKGGRGGGGSPGLHKRISLVRAFVPGGPRGRSGRPPRPVPDLPGLHPCPREGGALPCPFASKKMCENPRRAEGTATKRDLFPVGSGAKRRWRRSINLPFADWLPHERFSSRPTSDLARASD